MRYIFPLSFAFALSLGLSLGCSEDGGEDGGEAIGILDPTFDGDGIVVHDGAVGQNSSDYGYDLSVDTAGRIVVTGLGLMSGAGSYHMVIWRYDSDGALDPAFGDEGVVVYTGAAESSEGYAVGIDATGKVVVAGSSYGPTTLTIWRYDSDGALDPTFGDGGVVVSDWPAYGHDLAIDSEGRILVTGSAGGSMVLWRYNADGTPDTTFGVDGFVLYRGAAGGTGPDEGYGLTVDEAGKILVVGQSQSPNQNYDMVIWRYLDDGTLDTSFGIDGIAVHDGAVANVDSGGGAVAIDATGKILVSGYSYNTRDDWDMALWRYKANGTPDASFGVDGIVVHDGAAGGWGNDEGYDLTVTAKRTLVAGRSANARGDYDMVIWSFSANGTLDPSFGVDGIVVHDGAAGGSGHDYGYAITVDAAARIVVSGTSTNAVGNRDMVIWRYQ
jgi:uncharacterized delta-60 repeat protein